MPPFMRSDSFKSSKPTPPGARPAASRARAAGGEKKAEEEIPDSPPPALRGEYLKVSWSYVYWCIGMLVWSVLCVVYFILTRQTTNMIIGIALGLLLVAMIVLPAMLFGGSTWYKRLGWMMLLLTLFSVMWIYPVIVVGLGIHKRIGEGRYHDMSMEDIWHIILSGLTVVVSAWTLIITWRSAQLVRKLYRGE